MTWETNKIVDKTCPKCGVVYEVTVTQLPLRDKDNFVCECGEELNSWNSTKSYDYAKKK